MKLKEIYLRICGISLEILTKFNTKLKAIYTHNQGPWEEKMI